MTFTYTYYAEHFPPEVWEKMKALIWDHYSAHVKEMNNDVIVVDGLVGERVEEMLLRSGLLELSYEAGTIRPNAKE